MGFQTQLLAVTTFFTACLVAIAIVLGTQLGGGNTASVTPIKIVNVIVQSINPNTFTVISSPSIRSTPFLGGFQCYSSTTHVFSLVCDPPIIELNATGFLFLSQEGVYTITMTVTQAGPNVTVGSQLCSVLLFSSLYNDTPPFYNVPSNGLVSIGTLAVPSLFRDFSNSATFSFTFRGTTKTQLPTKVFCQIPDGQTQFANLALTLQIVKNS